MLWIWAVIGAVMGLILYAGTLKGPAKTETAEDGDLEELVLIDDFEEEVLDDEE